MLFPIHVYISLPTTTLPPVFQELSLKWSFSLAYICSITVITCNVIDWTFSSLSLSHISSCRSVLVSLKNASMSKDLNTLLNCSNIPLTGGAHGSPMDMMTEFPLKQEVSTVQAHTQ